jgi:hypothetical protein
MGKSVDLEDTFLNISDDIEFTFPCAITHIELLIMTYLDFDRKYLICPEEKKLQIITQNETHISIVMPCSSEVLNESENIFRSKALIN